VELLEASIVVLAAGAITFAVGLWSEFLWAILIWLGIFLVGICLILLPPGSMIPSPDNDRMGFAQVGVFLFVAAPSWVCSTIGLIAAWIVKRKREAVA
jgi:signal peptidase I